MGSSHKRHTFATQLLKKNANLVSIQQLMGHKGIESTYIYMQVTSISIG